MEHSVQSILGTHPRHPASREAQACVASCFECAETCKSCSDACLGEEMVQDMVRCIRINLDCADICNATGNLLLRQTETDEQVLRAQMEACMMACHRCEAECSNHAEAMEHCRICAESCHECAQNCKAFIG